MNCKEARELLPAYVLGALDPEELGEVEAHLKAGHEHDDELVELRATVFALDRFADARSLEPEERPLELRRTTPHAGAPARTGRFPSIAFAPAWRYGMVAAAALAIFATGWFVAGVTGGGAKHDVSLAIQGPAGQTVALTGKTSEERVTVAMSGFQALPSGRVYQLWAIRGEKWVRIGVCSPNAEGGWKGEFPFAIRSGERIALTVEPTGGSETPTSAPLMISIS